MTFLDRWPFLVRWLGALLLALALPGLLLPGGLDFSVCLCTAGHSADRSQAELAACCVSKCCEPSEQPGPTAANSEHGCAGCREISTQRRDDSTPARSSAESPIASLALPAPRLVLPFVNEPSWTPMFQPTARPAPPRLAPLPLRI